MTGAVPSSDQSIGATEPEVSTTGNSSCEGVSPKNLCWQEKRQGHSNLFYSHFIKDSGSHTTNENAEGAERGCLFGF